MTTKTEEKRMRDSAWAFNKRDERKDSGLCINGYAMATRGVRCTRCFLVHKYKAAVAKAMPEYAAATPCSRVKR